MKQVAIDIQEAAEAGFQDDMPQESLWAEQMREDTTRPSKHKYELGPVTFWHGSWEDGVQDQGHEQDPTKTRIFAVKQTL